MDVPTLIDLMWTVVAFIGVALGYVVGWKLGASNERRRTEERIEQDVRRRRNALLDRGRTTDRRPEHDGQPPSHVSRIRVTSQRVVPGDQPQPRL